MVERQRDALGLLANEKRENEALRWNLTALNTALWQACGGDSKKIALYIENAGGDKDDIDAALQEPKP